MSCSSAPFLQLRLACMPCAMAPTAYHCASCCMHRCAQLRPNDGRGYSLDATQRLGVPVGADEENASAVFGSESPLGCREQGGRREAARFGRLWSPERQLEPRAGP